MNSLSHTDVAASRFLDALSAQMQAQSSRVPAPGTPGAAHDHFVMMTLLNRLRTVPSDRGDWQSYGENILATTHAYHRHLQSGALYGAPIVAGIIRTIESLLGTYKPACATGNHKARLENRCVTAAE